MLFKETTVDLRQVAKSEVKATQHLHWKNSDLFICVLESGQLLVCDLKGETQQTWELGDAVDTNLEIAIHVYDAYLAVVNAKGLNGLAFKLGDPEWRMPLTRVDYHSGNCTWPIGFYRRDGDVFLMHGTLWNRIDFTNLETGQCVTHREVTCKKDDQEAENYLDYFHSKLHMSPDEKHFVINGWHWGPWDQLFTWNIDQFQVDFEPGGRGLHVYEVSGYNWDRPCCFVDNETIAWGYNEREAENEETPKDHRAELIFQNIHTKKVTHHMKFEPFHQTTQWEIRGRLWFEGSRKWYVWSSNVFPEAGLEPSPVTAIADENGSTIRRWPETAQFVSTKAALIGFLDGNQIRVVHLPADS